ncbi:hypothetical protein V8C37DRAFT_269966 [Trichoderma ceciliae]
MALLLASAAVSGLGRFVYDQYNTLFESQAQTSDDGIPTKRRKLSMPSELDTSIDDDEQFHWIDKPALADLVQQYREFAASFAFIWKTAMSTASRATMSTILYPLRMHLVNDPSELQQWTCGSRLVLNSLFEQHCRRTFEFLDRVYDAERVIKLRDQWPSVPTFMDEKPSPRDLEMINRIRDFFSTPGLPEMCANILAASGFDNVQVSTDFINRIVLDMGALIHKRPLPSYVSSSEFREQLEKLFPSPHITDSNIEHSLPGSFPEIAPESFPDVWLEIASESEPSTSLSSPCLPERPTSTSPIVSDKPASTSPTLCDSDLQDHTMTDVKSEPEPEPAKKEEEEITVKGIKTIPIKEEHQPIDSKQPTKGVIKVDVPLIPSCLIVGDRHRPNVSSVRFMLDPPSPSISAIDDDDNDIAHLIMDVEYLKKSMTRPQRLYPAGHYDEDDDESFLDLDELLEYGRDLSQRLRSMNAMKRPLETPKPDPSDRIEQLMALPSVEALKISDESKFEVEKLQKQAAATRIVDKQREKLIKERLQREEALRKLRERTVKGPRQPVVTPLSETWIEKIISTVESPETEVVAKTCQGTPLRQHDFATVVAAKTWLNDEIVNGALAGLEKEINLVAGITDFKQQGRKCLVMNSFFWPRVKQAHGLKTQSVLRRMGVTPKNFLLMDTVLVPICEDHHWTLLVLQPKKRKVMHLDSFNRRSLHPDLALAWMSDYLGDLFTAQQWEVMIVKTPQQTNGYDCGVHVITNGVCLALGLDPISSYRVEEMPLQRLRIAGMLLHGGFNGDFDLWQQ